jgi:predicted nuclease with TOPRIM domain
VFRWLRRKFRELASRRRLSKATTPETFQAMAAELRELARIAEQVCGEQEMLRERVERIKAEMDELERMTDQPDFRRLSMEQKLELRKSLHESREQLQQSVRIAPSPTKLLQ